MNSVPETDYLEEPSAGSHCAAWLADNRKKSLLAHAGVGTIDQALLAILQSKHQCLRQFGLLGKVLVVDEVHANDAYMHRLLCRLLAAHAAAGGSAVLLSATLPLAMRRELVAAFNTHAQYPLGAPASGEYPLLSAVLHDGLREVAVATRPIVRRTLHFKPLRSLPEAVQWVVGHARAGACVCWIRNSVADAIEAWEALARLLPAGDVDLFHARFALGDRLEIENRVLDRFGRHGATNQRAGKVLIATQVVEQSLDVDFDVLVSDLAPVDLLIQRAGRMRRHVRDRRGGLKSRGEDERPAVPMAVLAPAAQGDIDEAWITGLLPRTARVYPDHAQLWRTQVLLEAGDPLRVPEDLRAWIEAVYGPDAVAAPQALQVSESRVLGERRSHDSLGIGNAIALDRGYQAGGPGWWAESRTPTRLGEPTATLRLLRWDGAELGPFRAGEPWAMSEVVVAERSVAAAATPANSEVASQLAVLVTQWRHAYVVPVVLTKAQGGGWTGAVSNGEGTATIQYDSCRGLEVQ